jgi:hypothetical protein
MLGQIRRHAKKMNVSSVEIIGGYDLVDEPLHSSIAVVKALEWFITPDIEAGSKGGANGRFLDNMDFPEVLLERPNIFSLPFVRNERNEGQVVVTTEVFNEMEGAKAIASVWGIW